MKSILIEKPNQLAIVEREIPTPSAGEVRVKVKLAGICGSDSHIYRGHNPFAKYPRVIGHEFFGVIDAVGDGVESARVGDWRTSTVPGSVSSFSNTPFVVRYSQIYLFSATGSL